MKKIFLAFVAISLCISEAIVLTMPSVSSQEQQQDTQPNARFEKLLKSENKILNRYIVVLEDWAVRGGVVNELQTAVVANELSIVYGGKIDRVYESALSGYSIEMTEEEAKILSVDPRVKYIEPDSVMYISATQTGATWGLDRIDQRNSLLDNNYTYSAIGRGVNVYVVDTGIRFAHTEFDGRARLGVDVIDDGRNGNDCNGHGTHVAGTIGGETYGVAKRVRLFSVRTFGCTSSTPTSSVIAGVDWITRNHIKPAVANMSLGGGVSTSLDEAVNNGINAGVTFVVSAGNSDQNACNFSPARTGRAITVGSTNRDNARSYFSNFGSCVDVFAPGSDITSAWYTGNRATRVLSGTSMAAPHVAGVAALYLQGDSGASPVRVRNRIVNNSTVNQLRGIGPNSPNRLLYSLF